MAKKRNTGLGKGLSALIRDTDLRPDGTLAPEESKLKEIDLSAIQPNRFQPRKEFEPRALEELSRSIEESGVIQPITVRKITHGYELITGERRCRAAKLAGLEVIPAYILDKVSDEEMLEFALIENVQREKLNPIELAGGYQQLMNRCGLTQDEIAKKIGKDRSTVTNIIRLLKLPADIQDSLKKAQITSGHGRALITLPSEKAQTKIWQKIVRNDLSVRKTEQAVKEFSKGLESRKGNGKKQTTKDPFLLDLENRLRVRLGTKIRLRKKRQGGTIEIEYYSNDDLERLLDILES